MISRRFAVIRVSDNDAQRRGDDALPAAIVGRNASNTDGYYAA